MASDFKLDLKWNAIFYRFPELMLPILIERHDKKKKKKKKKKNHCKNERLTESLQTVRWHDHFIKPFLDNKMSIFEEYGAF